MGHVQLMFIDRAKGTCELERVLVFKRHRGKGFGRPLVASALDAAFTGLDLAEVTLRAFAFNAAALATYRALGFVEDPQGRGACEFEGERWEALTMRLSRERWKSLT